MLSLAKKKFDKICISANAGTPYPKSFKAVAVISTSFIEKDPYPNNAFTISLDAKINPKLAGTAAGLGSAIMIGGGAGLSAVANFILISGSSEIPLIMLMWASVFCGLCSIAYVSYRKKILKV